MTRGLTTLVICKRNSLHVNTLHIKSMNAGTMHQVVYIYNAMGILTDLGITIGDHMINLSFRVSMSTFANISGSGQTCCCSARWP